MTTILRNRYWRGAIFVPVLGALVGYIVPTEYGLILTGGFIIVAIPYVPFAALMWWLVGRAHSLAAVIGLALAAPAIFLPFFVAYVAVLGLAFSWAEWFTSMGEFLPLVLGVGYVYVALFLIVFYLLKLVVSRATQKNEPGVIA